MKTAALAFAIVGSGVLIGSFRAYRQLVKSSDCALAAGIGVLAVISAGLLYHLAYGANVLNIMNEDQVTSLVRAALALISGWLVGHGYQTESDAALYSGFAMAVVPVAWSLYAHRDAGRIASAAAVPDVQKIVTTPERAAADPSDKVVKE